MEDGVVVIGEGLQLFLHVVQLQKCPEGLGVEGAVHRRREKLQDGVVLCDGDLDELRRKMKRQRLLHVVCCIINCRHCSFHQSGEVIPDFQPSCNPAPLLSTPPHLPPRLRQQRRSADETTSPPLSPCSECFLRDSVTQSHSAVKWKRRRSPVSGFSLRRNSSQTWQQIDEHAGDSVLLLKV